MFENDSDTNSSPSQNNDKNNTSAEYLTRAAQACASGDAVLGMHLYMAAFERASHDSYLPDATAIEGLKQAWELACQHKERSLAEHIFEKLEPYLSTDEIEACADQLQRLALDKLEEFGLSREDIEGMTDMLSQDFFGMNPSTFLMKFEQGAAGVNPANLPFKGLMRKKEGADAEAPVEGEVNATADSAASDSAPVSAEASEDPAASEPAPAEAGAAIEAPAVEASEESSPENVEPVEADAVSQSTDQAIDTSIPKLDLTPFGGGNTAFPTGRDLIRAALGGTVEAETEVQVERMTYKDLIGYETTIESMKNFGIGIQGDPQFEELVKTLNAKHGLNKIPNNDTLFFRSPVREDANQFMLATMGEIDLPSIRMRMEENLQGMPVLCVMASSDSQPKLNATKNAFESGGVLILEDIDMWGSPLMESGVDDPGNFLYAQLSRGAREAINLIRTAVENPDVYVMVSATEPTEIDDFFFDILEPITVIDIEAPNEAERGDLWNNIAQEHPSIRGIDRAALVRYSTGMSRFDIYMAAREAVEEAYKASLSAKKFVAVSKENIFEKVAAYQPLESDEYKQLEDAVIDDFRNSLDNLDELLKGSGE